MYIELDSESEVYEYAKEHEMTVESFTFTDSGVKARLKRESSYCVKGVYKYNSKDRKSIIYTIIDAGSKLYLKERGTTFNARDAKKFDYVDAEEKVKCMNRNSQKYLWRMDN